MTPFKSENSYLAEASLNLIDLDLHTFNFAPDIFDLTFGDDPLFRSNTLVEQPP